MANASFAYTYELMRILDFHITVISSLGSVVDFYRPKSHEGGLEYRMVNSGSFTAD